MTRRGVPGQYPRLSVCALTDMGPDIHSQQHRNFSVLFSTGSWTTHTHKCHTLLHEYTMYTV